MSLELIDVYNEKKQKTGKIKERDQKLFEQGEYALAVKAIIINSDKKILLSKRSENKKTKAGFWEINGGVCLAGESSLQGIVREIKEELGLDLSKYKEIFYKEYRKKQVFDDIYLFKVDIDISKLEFSDREVEDAKWVTIEEYEQLNRDEQLLYYDEFNRKDYKKCIELLFC